MRRAKLSVNINKIATLRNARGKNTPNLSYFAEIALKSQAIGITVHPRPDERHIRYKDITELKELLKKYPKKEFNIEGYPSARFIKMIQKIKPHQITLVPDSPHVITSSAGWDFIKNKKLLKKTVRQIKDKGLRCSLFLDPLTFNKAQYQALIDIAPDRVEFYTEPYAESFHNPAKKKKILAIYKKWLEPLKTADIKINVGHDLNEENLGDLLKTLPETKELSIGQALISDALEKGFFVAIQSYLKAIKKAYK